MRTYPVNSPSAAARIVALTMLADGDLATAEIEALQRAGGCERLGLTPDQMHGVLHALCEDMLEGARVTGTEACEVDTHALARLLGEVDDAALRQRVLALCLAVAEADERISDSEALVLTHAVEHWGLQGSMLAPPVSRETT